MALLVETSRVGFTPRDFSGVYEDTCPGLNGIYADTDCLITEHDFEPSHDARALLSCHFVEGSGSPSHVKTETPGSIQEGGERGSCLAVAFGSVMDKPNLSTVAVIGDGESETGPTAIACHAHKFLDPAESGAVLPILHVNGYKIGERTIPGTMDDLELACLDTGYGYQVRIVEYGAIPHGSDHEHDVAVNYDMAVSMQWALDEIKRIQNASRSGNPIVKPRWPMIIMRTPKGWTGPRIKTHPIEGSWRAHQVPLADPLNDKQEFDSLVQWLKSYHPEILFHSEVDSSHSKAHVPEQKADGIIDVKATRIIPKNLKRRMGSVDITYRGITDLKTPEWKTFETKPGETISNLKAVGQYVAKVVELNPSNFRIFSPDELSSNKLDESLKVTHRNFQWDPETANNGGRVIEMLSEHTLQGWMQGYTLTGRHALFPSYESFLGIVQTMIEQYAKFVKMGLETKWRGDTPGLTYIMTSTLWRQEHNGYSHQNPGLIGSFISLPRNLARIYFPADANTSVCTIDHCLRAKNNISLIVGSKNPTLSWLSVEEAERHCIAGASVWTNYSSDGGVNPDVVLVGCGVEVTFETIAAAALLRNAGIRVRVVNVNDLLVLGAKGGHPHALTEESFESIFTVDKPVIITFHGYPKDIASLLFSRKSHVGRSRFDILGYIEQGTTTTPWSMLRLNDVSRYTIASTAVLRVARMQPNHQVTVKAHEWGSYWRHQLVQHDKYVVEHGEDPEWCGQIPQLVGDAA
ncbi:hypothetical protein TREMEDRAFT_69240 [Tremella mesenterica DSM 1558]|uniref:uncharacterized protein n=1 Tax=Tremella mesenterica (strain ATCC 24925 / CBS 8224 / DSM 1558 / NBRC 9311 / NRRL Y-6157 / RJB 2259-6 / UBC 559-6) TaxID=578456 RepID=UPI0003F49ECB|nr:uncharacterized protein TREMEDRAFT_69240 [Tremella mesenterica DSM 1558]EIW68187.1 hypothetical protein TREMEDRAFT_69240 [Tremella mesenterica DSM 1558]